MNSIAVDVGEYEDLRTFFGESARQCLTDSARRSRDYNDFVVQIHGGTLPVRAAARFSVLQDCAVQQIRAAGDRCHQADSLRQKMFPVEARRCDLVLHERGLFVAP